MQTFCPEQLERDGFDELPGVYDSAAIDSILAETAGILGNSSVDAGAIRSEKGTIYACRNVLALWPGAATVWRVPMLGRALSAVLGPGFGLVRALFFDKPPEQSWTLPWHKDLTIAVLENRRPSRRFTKPTRKAGVAHVEAPLEVLEGMLTVRIHLDAVTDENGPLKVIPGSHRTGKTMPSEDVAPRVLHAARGDVLLMRPLLVHCSGRSAPATQSHRRVLHLEFAASSELADGYAWHDFVPGIDGCAKV